jgi:SAM-dependent methyltransferase
MAKMACFVKAYLKDYADIPLKIVDVGARAPKRLNQAAHRSSYRHLFEGSGWNYRGLDTTPGDKVDIVTPDPCCWDSIKDETIDVIVSGQALEHVEFPWKTASEISRVLRPGGLACLIVPSAGPEHSYPLDCWRIYPDGIKALAKWANLQVVEVFTDWGLGTWQDTFSVLQKPGVAFPASSAFPAFQSKGVARSFYLSKGVAQMFHAQPKYYVHAHKLLKAEGRLEEAAEVIRAGTTAYPKSSELFFINSHGLA